MCVGWREDLCVFGTGVCVEPLATLQVHQVQGSIPNMQHEGTVAAAAHVVLRCDLNTSSCLGLAKHTNCLGSCVDLLPGEGCQMAVFSALQLAHVEQIVNIFAHDLVC